MINEKQRYSEIGGNAYFSYWTLFHIKNYMCKCVKYRFLIMQKLKSDWLRNYLHDAYNVLYKVTRMRKHYCPLRQTQLLCLNYFFILTMVINIRNTVLRKMLEAIGLKKHILILDQKIETKFFSVMFKF